MPVVRCGHQMVTRSFSATVIGSTRFTASAMVIPSRTSASPLRQRLYFAGHLRRFTKQDVQRQTRSADYQNDDRAKKDMQLGRFTNHRMARAHAYTVRQTAVTDRQQPPARSVPGIRYTRFPAASCPVRRLVISRSSNASPRPPSLTSSGMARKTPAPMPINRDWVGITKLPATVDHWAATLHFRVVALYGRNEVGIRLTRRHGKTPRRRQDRCSLPGRRERPARTANVDLAFCT